ncbi:MAG: UbiD family decarboxylase, partial [Alphaproteobacteria bacterium]|nr:UbiD family decarboxylase [Alphaproteobacteria bacterium]
MDTPAPKRIANAPDITSLRSTIEWLRENGDLIETDKEVDPDLQLTGLQKHLDGGPPILFENVKGKPHARAITNLFSDIEVIDRMFGFDGPVDRTRKIAQAINNPTPTVEVDQDAAPCQEHV